MSKKNPEIEVLRAIAVLMVLVSHVKNLLFWGSPHAVNFWNHAPMWTGVDLFFVISGYVITLSFLEHSNDTGTTREKTIVALKFWIRRAWRLWPSAWTWIAIVTICSVVFNSSGAFETTRGNLADMVSVLLLIANLHFFYCFHGTGAVCGNNSIYWSLAVEEQFYMLFPILLSAVPRKWWPAPFMALAAAQFFADRPVWSFFWAIRTDAICLGVLLAMVRRNDAYLLTRPSFLSRRFASVAWTTGLIALLCALPSPLFFTVPFYTGLAAIVSVALVWTASFEHGFICPKGAIRTILGWIGARSYALYLIHFPAFMATREIWSRMAGKPLDGTFTLRFILTAFAATFLLADLNFRLIETPLRRAGARIAEAFGSRAARVEQIEERRAA
ncbi:acyltransferase family protein [Paraburkholderia sp. RL17-347-BIC-D]|uniref:acyltransferase family protein n=1 Tax=Paraburkholderia sp. RL17-347-BIC-D TaxID=3031632 RepID=UPI0038B899C4